jgi:hypothetical protein
MKVYPLNRGNHNNLYFQAKIKNSLTFKIVGYFNTGEAFIFRHSVNPKMNRQILPYLNQKTILQEISNKLFDKFDFELKTNVNDLFTKMTEIELKELNKQNQN